MDLTSPSAVETLARLRWDVFASLTLRGNLTRPHRAHGLLWQWCRQASVLGEAPCYSRMLIAVREEFGEIGRRPHFHVLLGGMGASNLTTTCYKLRYCWGSVLKAGFCDCRMWDAAQVGCVSYLLKTLGADSYELGKFGWSDGVTLSSSVGRVVRSLERMGSDATTCAVR